MNLLPLFFATKSAQLHSALSLPEIQSREQRSTFQGFCGPEGEPALRIKPKLKSRRAWAFGRSVDAHAESLILRVKE